MGNRLFDSASSGASVLVSETGIERLQLVARSGTSTTMMGGSREPGQLPSGPSPFDLISAALGECTAMTVRLFAEKAKIPLDRVEVSVTHKSGKGETRDSFTRIVKLEGIFDARQKERLLEVSNRCPVGKFLMQVADMTTEIYGEGTAQPEIATTTEASTTFKYMDEIYDLAVMMLKTGNY